ncbi:hypothetical protein CDAR_526391 [Caerostris darwini]|uniref:Uncharacterized protein n=1 Tax=Caerostris darwini TaxID=1538125 RepID=A0AAV4R3Z8_9ARAC|nr:hypothetical protein CDAR_526391 [Caerostris darwini]
MDIGVIGKVIPTTQKFGFLVFKNAKGNRTLLGADFFTAAGIVLNLQKIQRYFSGTPHLQFDLIATPPDIKSLLVMPPASHPYQRSKNQGTHLSRRHHHHWSNSPMWIKAVYLLADFETRDVFLFTG